MDPHHFFVVKLENSCTNSAKYFLQYKMYIFILLNAVGQTIRNIGNMCIVENAKASRVLKQSLNSG